jgi:hypothetical protein
MNGMSFHFNGFIPGFQMTHYAVRNIHFQRDIFLIIEEHGKHHRMSGLGRLGRQIDHRLNTSGICDVAEE